MLVQQEGKAQGNLNPHLYEMAASSPAAFHDITVATSGVSGCSLKTPSMCNNSVASPNGLTGGQSGYQVGNGYDEATGLGSLDVGKFFETYTPFKPPAGATGAASAITATTVTVAGTVNPEGQPTQYQFLYGTSNKLTNGALTSKETVTGSKSVAVSTKIASLTPGLKYYYQLQVASYGGAANGAIESFATPKAVQTITFMQPRTPVKYGAAPLTLSATSSSGLPITFTVVSGHASISGTTLTIKGAGTIVIEAGQAGNSSYRAAVAVKRSITVNKAQLTVAANNLSMTQGGKVPKLTYNITGFVNGDTAKVVLGTPTLTTTATSNSQAGKYPIIVNTGNMKAASYSFRPVNGTLTVNP